ncbi:MAG: SpoIIE family protein phosphatase [Saprospiraceae bacterium]|nr:SpoIIE family protein phosphatase [Saprospiraceae bacterium]
MHSLHSFLNHSFQKVFKEYQQQLEIEKLLAINDAMEASQQAMHENAEQMLRLHKQLTDSLQYAQRMQKAILPSEERMKGIFEDFFVIYQPKDIVSGDFFWCSRLDYTFVAVVDCTGHGVPGAFMSMIGYTLLKQIIVEKRMAYPPDILEQLDSEVVAALRQRDTHNRDGMDVCLCRFERQGDTVKLSFAGAKRPLYVCQEAQWQELPATRRHIGGMQVLYQVPFEMHELYLQKGDKMLCATDGLTDISNNSREKFWKVAASKSFSKSIQILP